MDSLEKILKPGKIEGKGRRDAAEDEIDSIINSINMSLSKLWEIVEDRGAWHAMVHKDAKNWICLSD